MKPERRGRKRKILLWLGLAVLLVGSLALTGAALYLAPYAEQTMDMSLLEIASVNRPSELYVYSPPSRQGRGGELHPAPNSALGDQRSRIHVNYEEIPTELIHAIVAIEDKRFWQHDGVDLLRTFHAGFQYLTGKATFGGSTVTQQLIKNLTGDDARTVERKLTEIYKALDLEKHLSKEEILEAYLNVINLAEGCFGVGAAAQRYFSKSVSDLTLSECATLAAITNNPARYDPLQHPQSNLTRRNTILREMAAQGYITNSERDEAMASELSLHPSAPVDPAPINSWYTDLVVADVIRDLQERLGYSYSAATILVYQGGLTIETAMDEALQSIVEAYYRDTANFPVGEAGRPQSGMILMDPHTGDVLAVAGAVGEKRANRIQSYATDTRRPAGSCIKPLTVYAPALEKGIITWATVMDDEPVSSKNGVPWPANADGLYRGRVTVGQAVAHSLNPVAVQILDRVGLTNAFSFAHDRLGMHNLVPKDETNVRDLTAASLALGQQTRGVTVRELTAAYTVFTDGVYKSPISYHRVLDANGKVLLENPAHHECEPAMSVENAAIMTQLLMEVTREGTAAKYMTLTEMTGIRAAGKTGTTQNNCDRWFVGYTPRLLAGVWMGYDYPTELKGISGNPCVGIWDDLMNHAEVIYEGEPGKTVFDIPDTLIEVEFCPLSGNLPNPYCADPVYGHKLKKGWFIRGTEPNQLCSFHTEPPISIIPEDPDDPLRIPILPEDISPDSVSLPGNEPKTKPWYSRWFSRFFQHDSQREEERLPHRFGRFGA